MGVVQCFEWLFWFQVGEQVVVVVVDKMNVFYVGVDNLVIILVVGILSVMMRVNVSGMDLQLLGGSVYIVWLDKFGKVVIMVFGEGLVLVNFEYWVKKILDFVLEIV